MKHSLAARLSPLPVAFGIAFAGCSGGDGDSGANPGGTSAISGGSSTTGTTGGRASLFSGGTNNATGGSATVSGGSPASGGNAGNAAGGALNPASGGAAAVSGGSTSGGASAGGGTAGGGTIGGTSSGDGFSSGLPKSATLDSLSPTDLVRLCEASQDHLEMSPALAEANAGLCRYGSIFLALFADPQTDEELRQLCQQGYDECVAEPFEREPCSMTSTCTATVAEFESCVDDYPTAAKNFEQIPACSTVTLDDLATVVAFTPATPAGCASLWEKCPEENDFGTE